MFLPVNGFNPLWINTALKRDVILNIMMKSFNPLWINTALKHLDFETELFEGFNPLWINTALKQEEMLPLALKVSIPYGLTLLSNSNLKFEKTTCISLYYSLGNFILRYISHKSRSMIKRLSFAILSYSLFSKKIT